MSTKSKIDQEISKELHNRINQLLAKTFEELSLLPATSASRSIVAATQVEFTVYQEKQIDGGLMILVRSDYPKFFGFVVYGSTDGFFISKTGQISDVPTKTILDFFA